MKILRANDFISERIQLQPITNAELEKAQKDITNIKILRDKYLDKNALAYNDIVFDAYGYTYIYLSDYDLKRFKYENNLLVSFFKPWSTGKDDEKELGFMSVNSYEQNLTYEEDNDFDIVQIAKGVVTQKDIDFIHSRNEMVEFFKKNKNFSEYR